MAVAALDTVEVPATVAAVPAVAAAAPAFIELAATEATARRLTDASPAGLKASLRGARKNL